MTAVVVVGASHSNVSNDGTPWWFCSLWYYLYTEDYYLWQWQWSWCVMHDVYVDHCGDAAVMKMPMMTTSHHPSIVWVTTNEGVVTKIVVRHANSTAARAKCSIISVSTSILDGNCNNVVVIQIVRFGQYRIVHIQWLGEQNLRRCCDTTLVVVSLRTTCPTVRTFPNTTVTVMAIASTRNQCLGLGTRTTTGTGTCSTGTGTGTGTRSWYSRGGFGEQSLILIRSVTTTSTTSATTTSTSSTTTSTSSSTILVRSSNTVIPMIP